MRRPEEVTVGDVLRAVEGVQTTLGMRNGQSQRTADLAELWEEIDRALSQVVDRLTFGELAERARIRAGSQAMYHI
jgi:DNA-binding IscR family transcriptional regulator